MIAGDLTVRKLMPHFAAEIGGVDVREPLEDETLVALRGAIHEFGVVVLRDQDIDDQQQVRFSTRFGALEMPGQYGLEQAGPVPNVLILSNLAPETGRPMLAADPRARYNEAAGMWHSDSSFKPVPAAQSILSGRIVPPEGGNTEFADMRIVWDELPEELKTRLRGRFAEHSIAYSQSVQNPDAAFFESEEQKSKAAPVRQPLIRKHPGNGRLAAYVGSHTSHIVDLPVNEGRAIIQDLLARATVPERIYSHRWQPKDLVIWDNPSVIHRSTKFDAFRYPRVMHRTTVAGSGPALSG